MMIVVTGFEGDVTSCTRCSKPGPNLLALDLQHGRIGRPPTGGYTATGLQSQCRISEPGTWSLMFVDIRRGPAKSNSLLILIEFRLLVSLVKRPGEVVSKRTLLEERRRREDDHVIAVTISSKCT